MSPGPVKPLIERVIDARVIVDRFRMDGFATIGASAAEEGLLAIAEAAEDLVASANDAAALLEQMQDSKKLALSDRQREAIQSSLARLTRSVRLVKGVA